MIDTATIGEIVAQYEKHGWRLRRALLSQEDRAARVEFPKGVRVIDSDMDALWFSRTSRPERETWELRRISGAPFALVAVVETSATDEEIDAALAQVENDMRGRTFA